MTRLAADRMFVAVLESGGFAAAAKRLGVSSGQASKLVAKLEAELGVDLLRRTTRKLAATEIGQAYFDRVRDILAELDALDASVRSQSAEPTGRLRLSAPTSFGVTELSPVLAELMARHPGLDIEVSFTDRVVGLVDEGFDAAVRVGRVDDQTLIARKLTEARIVLAAAPDYLARVGAPARPEDLAAHACVIDTNFRDPLRWTFRRPGQAETFTVPVAGRLRLSSAEACVAAAERGLGVVRLPSFVAGASLAAGRLAPVLAAFEPAPLPVNLVYPPTRHLQPKVRSLVDFLVQRFKGTPRWDLGW